MPYEYEPTSAHPRLLILLTDELEESVRVVNEIIGEQILRNYNGDAPKNRCFISVIGYNHTVKKLCCGLLKDLDVLPLRYETTTKKISDGVGGIVEVEVKQPVWVEPSTNQAHFASYAEAVKQTIELVRLWSESQVMAPIVVDISKECHAQNATKEIEQLKAISTADGKVLFWGSFSECVDTSESNYSSMPEEWKWRFSEWEINEKDFHCGIINREKTLPIISIVTYTGGLPSDFNGFTI